MSAGPTAVTYLQDEVRRLTAERDTARAERDALGEELWATTDRASGYVLAEYDLRAWGGDEGLNLTNEHIYPTLDSARKALGRLRVPQVYALVPVVTA